MVGVGCKWMQSRPKINWSILLVSTGVHGHTVFEGYRPRLIINGGSRALRRYIHSFSSGVDPYIL